MNSTKKELKRELILKTVSQIVHEEDVEKLTLEAVAKKAGISKGGLLYHFPNKDADSRYDRADIQSLCGRI